MKLATKIIIAFAIVLFLSIIDTSSNFLLSLKVEKNIEFLNKSQDIMRNSGKLHKSIIEMQSSFRGYLLTGDSQSLVGYDNGLKNIPSLISRERNYIKENSNQLVLLNSIEKTFSDWVQYTNHIISSRQKNWTQTGKNENEFSKMTNYGEDKIDETIRPKFLAFDKLEYRKRRLHSANLITSIDDAHIYSFTFFLLTIIIGISSTAYIVYSISKRIRTMVRLAENISGGHFTHIEDDHKDEMSSLSNSLNIMSDKLNKNITTLEKQNTELDTFAYVVSHDLKAPIRGIHNVVKWIEEDFQGELSPELKKYLEIIPQRTKRMEDLINGLLAYARTREKKLAEHTNVYELVNEIVKSIVPPEIKVEIDTLPIITTERFKLEQVFTNLISNSVKHIDPEKGFIRISCKKIHNYYQFSVKDNGCGIEEEYHAKIFEMFQTLRERNEKESTGIGLALIKKIIDDKHCAIWVNSSLGNGAEFTFTWPLEN